MEKIKEFLNNKSFIPHGTRGIKWKKTIHNSLLPVVVYVSVYQSKKWFIAVDDVDNEFLNAINILETENEDKVIKLLDALIGNG